MSARGLPGIQDLLSRQGPEPAPIHQFGRTLQEGGSAHPLGELLCHFCQHLVRPQPAHAFHSAPTEEGVFDTELVRPVDGHSRGANHPHETRRRP